MLEIDPDMKRMWQIIREKYEQYAAEQISEMRTWDFARLTGKDYLFKDFWEEFAYQIKWEESTCFGQYEWGIQEACKAYAGGLPEDELKLLWMDTQSYCDWQYDEYPDNELMAQAVAERLYEYLCEAACYDAAIPEPPATAWGRGDEAEDDDDGPMPVEEGEVDPEETPGSD